VKRFLASGRRGWYLRVRTEGATGAGGHWELRSREPAGFSVAELIGPYRGREIDRARLAAAAGLKALPAPWREELAARLPVEERAPRDKPEQEERA